MPAGLQIFNDHGTVQIDSDLRMPLLVATGNMAVSGGLCSLSRSVPAGAFPLVAVRPTDFTFYFGINVSGTTWTWNFGTDQANGTTIPYWVFDKKDVTPPAPGFGGLALYDETGACTFTSDEKMMRIRSVVQTRPLLVGGATLTFDAGRTYAVVFGTWCEDDRYFAHDDHWESNILTAKGATDGVQLGWKFNGSTPGTLPYADIWADPQMLVVDVTGF